MLAWAVAGTALVLLAVSQFLAPCPAGSNLPLLCLSGCLVGCSMVGSGKTADYHFIYLFNVLDWQRGLCALLLVKCFNRLLTLQELLEQ